MQYAEAFLLGFLTLAGGVCAIDIYLRQVFDASLARGIVQVVHSTNVENIKSKMDLKLEGGHFERIATTQPLIYLGGDSSGELQDTTIIGGKPLSTEQAAAIEIATK